MVMAGAQMQTLAEGEGWVGDQGRIPDPSELKGYRERQDRLLGKNERLMHGLGPLLTVSDSSAPLGRTLLCGTANTGWAG